MIPVSTLYDEYIDRPKLQNWLNKKNPLEYIVPPPPQEGSEQKFWIKIFTQKNQKLHRFATQEAQNQAEKQRVLMNRKTFTKERALRYITSVDGTFKSDSKFRGPFKCIQLCNLNARKSTWNLILLTLLSLPLSSFEPLFRRALANREIIVRWDFRTKH